MGDTNTACGWGVYNLTAPDASGELTATVNLRCPFGKLSTITTFGQLPAAQTVNCREIIENEKAAYEGEEEE